MIDAKQESPHVLVSDLAMPDKDGFGLIARVRKLGYTVKELPAVALTAYATTDYARRAPLSGFSCASLSRSTPII